MGVTPHPIQTPALTHNPALQPKHRRTTLEAIAVRGREFTYSHTIGNAAVFNYPVHLCLDSDNILYVVNRGHDGEWIFGINKITVDETEIGKFGGYGESGGRFIWPTAIAVDSHGLAYVADEWLNRISIFDTTVEFNGADIEEKNFLRKWGVGGSEPGQLGAPASLVLGSNEDLYITEQGNNRVSKFTRKGDFLLTFGGPGSSPGRFDKPWGITVDTRDNVYVADWGNNRIQKFTPEGEFLQTIGVPGKGRAKLHRPSDVAVDSDGDVYICDWGQDKVEVYDADGSHLTTLYGDSKVLSPRGVKYLELNIADLEKRRMVTNFEPEYRFTLPTGVEVDNEGRIYVVDNIRFRVQVYRKEKT